MKKQWRALCMAWGMFCIVPCPSRKWDEAARSWMIVWFPLVGLLAGGVWRLLALLPGSMLTAALLCAAPFVVTGFLHLDGYMDCCDAILSRRELAVRQKILKDSHVGAFAVIGLAILFLLQFAAFCTLNVTNSAPALLLLPVCTRAAAGLCVSTMRPMGTSQYGGDFAREKKTPQCVCLALWLALALAAGWLFCGLRALALGAGALCVWLAALYGKSQLGGMSGDVSGFALTLGELAGVLCLCIF